VKLLLLALTPVLLWLTGSFRSEELEIRKVVRALQQHVATRWPRKPATAAMPIER
jgi:hypothetical protein